MGFLVKEGRDYRRTGDEDGGVPCVVSKDGGFTERRGRTQEWTGGEHWVANVDPRLVRGSEVRTDDPRRRGTVTRWHVEGPSSM